MTTYKAAGKVVRKSKSTLQGCFAQCEGGC